MAHDHSHSHAHADDGHDHGHSHGPRRDTDRRALWIAFAITTLFMIAETIGGLMSGSLALTARRCLRFLD